MDDWGSEEGTDKRRDRDNEEDGEGSAGVEECT